MDHAEVPAEIVIAKLQERIAEDALLIAMLKAQLSQALVFDQSSETRGE